MWRAVLASCQLLSARPVGWRGRCLIHGRIRIWIKKRFHKLGFRLKFSTSLSEVPLFPRNRQDLNSSGQRFPRARSLGLTPEKLVPPPQVCAASAFVSAFTRLGSAKKQHVCEHKNKSSSSRTRNREEKCESLESLFCASSVWWKSRTGRCCHHPLRPRSFRRHFEFRREKIASFSHQVDPVKV